MKKIKILFILLFFTTVNLSFSQKLQITNNQEILIKRKAIGSLKDLEYKINQIIESDIEEREIIISNIILPNSILTSTFLGDQVIIEDDFETRSEVNITLNKTVENYLRDIGLFYGKNETGEFKNESKSVKFYDIKSESIFINKYGQLYIKVNFKVFYNGIDSRSHTIFKSSIPRVAEILILPNGNSFNTTINGISFKKENQNDTLEYVKVIDNPIDNITKINSEEIEKSNLTLLKIISNKKEGKVSINNKEIGIIENYTFQTILKPSIYKLKIENQFYASDDIDVMVNSDTINEININLHLIKSVIKFEVKPTEYYIEVNNKVNSQDNIIVDKNSIVEYKINKPGFEEIIEKIYVTSDTVLIQRQLKPILKNITFFSKLNNVKYTLNNNITGNLPLKHDFQFGQNSIQFTKKGFYNYTMNILSNNSSSETIEIQLQKDIDYYLKKEISKKRIVSISKFIVNSGLLYVSYSNFEKYTKELNELKKNQNAFSDSDKKDKIQVYQYLSGGGCLVFSIGTIKNLISSIYINKQKVKNNLK